MSRRATSPCTVENIGPSGLVCAQYREGYRFSIDSVLLAAFCRPKKGEEVLDLGAGSGVVSLLIARRHPGVRLTALELQPRLVELAQRNVAANGMEKRIVVQEGDLRRLKDIFAAGSFSRVLCNPPYYEPLRGRRSADPEAAVARHADSAPITAVADAAAWCLKTGGRASFIYPAPALVSLVAALRRYRLEPKRLRPVYSYPGEGGRARLFLLEAVRNGGEGLDFMPPLYVYEERNGAYSVELAQMFGAP